MSYEPRIGDLVQTAAYGDAVEVVGTYAPDLWRYRRGLGFGSAHISRITPLRPDAPGQRVRAYVSSVPGVTLRAEVHNGRDGFVVRWEDGATGPWAITNLIRIADQAPAAPVAKTCAPPEAPPTEDARKESGYQTAPAAINQGPTCQHCGSGIVAGLLRDACPRGCDLTLRAAEPEPNVMIEYQHRGEPAWCAAGRGLSGRHPTKEGAIAAWREAVRRG